MIGSSGIFSDDWGAMMLKLFRPVVAVTAVLLAVVLTGCAGGDPVPIVTPSPTPTPTGPPVLTDDELYALAVSQYEKAYAIIIDVERQGGAVALPDASRDVMMDPAWTAYNDMYLHMLLNGDRFVGEPQHNITAIARLNGEALADGTVIALQTCELYEGASVIDKDGNTIHDGSSVIEYAKVYLKYDTTDNQLKVFILNKEAVDTCPL